MRRSRLPRIAAAACLALAGALALGGEVARAADDKAALLDEVARQARRGGRDGASALIALVARQARPGAGAGALSPLDRDDVIEAAEAALLASAAADAKAEAVIFERLAGPRRADDAGVRLWLCDVAARRPGAPAERALLDALRDPSGLVLKRAVRHVGLRKCAAAVDPVIALLGRTEKGRDDPWLDCLRFLALVTGRDLVAAADWKAWWEANRAGFDPAKAKPAPPGGTTVERGAPPFFGPGTAVVSRRCVFVLDVSQSMSFDGPPLERTRMARLQAALRKLVADLPAATRFTIVTFGARIDSFRRDLTRADAETKAAALAFVDGLRPEGFTPTDEALRAAFALAGGADTFFVLSDGVPQRGKKPNGEPDKIDTGAILDEVAALNRFRRVKIHTVGIGEADRTFMERLALENDGTYVEAKPPPPPPTLVASALPDADGESAPELIRRFEAAWRARRAAGPEATTPEERTWREDDEAPFQSLLLDMIRLGGPEIARALSVATKTWTDADPDAFCQHGNLEALTALRRVQGAPDPLAVEVAGGDRLECVFPELPTIAVRLRNADPDGLPVDFTTGGDYRSGRQARFRIELTDASGRTRPMRPLSFGMGGGMFSRGPLAPGKEFSTDLALAAFVEPQPPGTYTAVVVYHDTITIADRTSADGLIVSRSAPFEVVVAPREIRLRREEQAEAEGLVRALAPAVPVRMVAGTYDPEAHADFIAPESPAGKLLALGWRAYPALRGAALRDAAAGDDAVRRAWILALLFSVTGVNDPQYHWGSEGEKGVLPDFETIRAPWRIEHREDGKAVGAAFTTFSKQSGQSKLDPAAQTRFAERWRGFEGAVAVRWLD